MAGEPQYVQDRRASRRTTTLYRPVLINTKPVVGFCLLRNISPEGMMGRFFVDLEPNLPVRVQFNPSLEATGRVSWSTDQMIGINFVPTIDVPTVLAGLSTGSVRGKPYRPLRLPIQVAVRIAQNGNEQFAEVQDISQKGLKIRTSGLNLHDEVTVHLDDLNPKKAIVRWIRSDMAGLNFIYPINFDDLGKWVVDRQYSSNISKYNYINI